jgi:hypothetical protein
MQMQHCARDLGGRIAIHSPQGGGKQFAAAEHAKETEHG